MKVITIEEHVLNPAVARASAAGHQAGAHDRRLRPAREDIAHGTQSA
jgi:hypothetical protein